MLTIQAKHPNGQLVLESTRPAYWDSEIVGDTAISNCPCSDLLVLYWNNHPVALFPGSPPDQASLNSLLYQLRLRAGQYGIMHDDV